jgi:ribosomal protein S18 acetylase RimI-like enzyme
MFDIRAADARDMAALHQLIEAAYRGDSARRGWTHEADLLGGQRIDRPALTAILDDPQQRLLLATRGGAVIGCVNIAALAGNRAYLGLLAVDPAQQAGGIGRALMTAAETIAAAAFGARIIEMTVIRQRRELIAYYRRRGYELTSETRPFPYEDRSKGAPARPDLSFVVLTKGITITV